MEISWFITERVILLRATEEKTVVEAADSQLTRYLQQGKTPIYLLIDAKFIEQRPTFMVFKRWEWAKQPALKQMLIFGLKDRTLQLVLTLASKLANLECQFFNSLDEASLSLKKLEPTLPILSGQTAMLSATAIMSTRQVERQSILKVLYEQLFKVADSRCDYCRTPQPYALELIPSEMTPPTDETVTFEKVHLLCFYCNKFIQNHAKAFDPVTLTQVALFNPRKDKWYEHFTWSTDYQQIVGLTPVGRATSLLLRLHDPYHMQLRQIGLKEGWHPPRRLDTAMLREYYFPANGKIRLEVSNTITREKHDVTVVPTRPMILGRSDTTSSQRPDVDFASFGGYRLGVSRVHARLNPPQNNMLTLTDLGSSNGTYVNNERVNFHESRRLSHADEIRMGKLIMNIYFEQPEKSPMVR